MLRLATLVAYLGSVHTMTDLTKNLLTPLKEEGEVCGYQSCRTPIEGQLNIHVIPHTHGELGYTRTFDQHFNGRDELFDRSNRNMKRILDYVITELWAQKDRTFTFSDLPYLYKWWSVRDETVHRMVYQLFRQGRLHIVGGGWSMTDESTATYQPIIDQFTFSLRKLNATFLDCARPYVTWQSDVFGHTGEFASLMAQMGFDGHFINPISYDDELERMRTKSLEFIWRGSPDLGISSDIFTHKLFDGYWAPPGFCFGSQCGDPLIVNSNSAFDNIKERVKLFVEAMQYRQSPHYATNHLVVMMGQRMGYYDASLWFENIEKLMRGVNDYSSSNNLNMFMYYSTPACYLKAIYKTNATFPVESNDFVPIAYDKNTHFSGIFTSRPTLKYAAREGNLYLQITKQLHVLARLKNNDKFFEDFHWIMGVLQDHNVLTGGMRPYVRDYYVNKLHKSLRSTEGIIRDGLINLMKTPKIGYRKCLLNISYCEYTNQDKYYIVIYNPLAWKVTIPVRLPVVEGRFRVFLPNLTMVPSVLMKIPKCIKEIPYNRTIQYNFELVFIAEDLPALGYRSYFIEKVTRMRRSVNSDDHFTKASEKNDVFSGSDNHFTVKIDEIGHSDDPFSNNGVNINEIGHSNDPFTNEIVKNDNNINMMKRSIESMDPFIDVSKNFDIDTIDIDLSNVNDINDYKHFIISRKIQHVKNKDNLTDEGGKPDKDGLLRNDKLKNYEAVHLQDVNLFMNNSNINVYGTQRNLDLQSFKKPNVTKTIKFNKNDKPDNDLKRIFDSIHDEGDNIELEIVYESAKKKQKHKTNNNITNKNDRTLNVTTPNEQFNIKYGVRDKIHDDNVTEYIVDIIKDHNSILKGHINKNNDSDYLNKDLMPKTNNDSQKYVKNKSILREHNTLENDSDHPNKDFMAKTNINDQKYVKNKEKCTLKRQNTHDSEYSNKGLPQKTETNNKTNVKYKNKCKLRRHNTRKTNLDYSNKDELEKTDIEFKKDVTNATKSIIKGHYTQKIDSEHSNKDNLQNTGIGNKQDVTNANKKILKDNSDHSNKDLFEKNNIGDRKDVTNANKRIIKGHNTQNNYSEHSNKDNVQKTDIDNKKYVKHENGMESKGHNTRKKYSQYSNKDLLEETNVYNKEYGKNKNKSILKDHNNRNDLEYSNKYLLKITNIDNKEYGKNKSNSILKGHNTQINDSDYTFTDLLKNTNNDKKEYVKNKNKIVLEGHHTRINDSDYSNPDLSRNTNIVKQEYVTNNIKMLLKRHNIRINDSDYLNKDLLEKTIIDTKKDVKNKNKMVLEGHFTRIKDSDYSFTDLSKTTNIDKKEYVKNKNKMVLEGHYTRINDSDYSKTDLSRNINNDKKENGKIKNKMVLEGHFTRINESDYLNKYFLKKPIIDTKKDVKNKNKMVLHGHFTRINESDYLNKNRVKISIIDTKKDVKNKNKMVLEGHFTRINDSDYLNKKWLKNTIIDTKKDVKYKNESVLIKNNPQKRDSDSNKDLLEKTNFDFKIYVKNRNKTKLKGLKRCNCNIGKLKIGHTKKNCKKATKHAIDQTFGNENYTKFTHFKEDEINKINDKITKTLTKSFKREIKDLKQIEANKIKFLKLEVEELQDTKQHEHTNPKRVKIKYLKRKIKERKQDIKKITNPKNILIDTNDAKNKNIKRQTSYIRSDGESLLDNYHHYEDDEYYGDVVYYDNNTDVFNKETDNNDYDMSSDDLPLESITTESTTQSATESTTQSTTQSTTERTTQSTTQNDTLNTTEKPIRSTIQSSARSVTRTSTQSSATTSTTTGTTENPLLSAMYSDSTETYISNEYVNITTDIHKNVTFVALANGLTMALNINFYYYASDDPMKLDRPNDKKPGAYVFRPMDPEPVFIAQKPRLEVYKSSEVQEIHSNTDFASFVIRLYRNTPYFEVQWILREIPVRDEIGKEIFIRYKTDLENRGVFYTDANGRQTVKRVYGHRPNYTPASPEAIAGNFYPVTSKISIEDSRRMIRFSVFNDRTQAGSSTNGEIDLMINRRILTDDAGIQAFINETENEIGTTISGKHYIYLTKLSTKVNKIFEKKFAKEIGLKPQIFVAKRNEERSLWKKFTNEFSGVKKLPIGLNILTLQEWNDGSFLVRIENYLEKSDIVKTGIKKVILKDLFTVFRITRVRETTLAGNIFLEDFQPLNWKKSDGSTEKLDPYEEVKVDEEITFKPQQIRTFIVFVAFHEKSLL